MQQRFREGGNGAPVRDLATLYGMPKAWANFFKDWHNQTTSLLFQGT